MTLPARQFPRAKNQRYGRERAITFFQQAAYALPVLPVAFLMSPLAVLQALYAKHFGLKLEVIAAVLLVSRLFDAITDPLIGYVSDRYCARGGTRKPFIAVGGLLLLVASWFLYVPPENVSAGYFLFWFLIFFLSFTLFEIPHMVWGGEMALSSQEKNKVYGFRAFFSVLGALLFYALPLLPLFDTSEFTPDTLKSSVLVAGSMMLPLLWLCLMLTPVGPTVAPAHQKKKESIRLVARSLLRNRPYLVLTGAHICTGFGFGVWFALLFFFVDGYLGLGEHFALVYVLAYGLSLLFLRPWAILASRKGKQLTWQLAMVLTSAGLGGFGFLSADQGSWIPLLICMVLIFGGLVAFGTMVPSLLSDLSDYGTLKSGRDRSATYFAIFTFINKTVGALGGALGLAMINWWGFDPAASTHSETSVSGLRYAVVWIPAFFFLFSLFLIGRIAITSRQHGIIRKRLLALTERTARHRDRSIFHHRTTEQVTATN